MRYVHRGIFSDVCQSQFLIPKALPISPTVVPRIERDIRGSHDKLMRTIIKNFVVSECYFKFSLFGSNAICISLLPHTNAIIESPIYPASPYIESTDRNFNLNPARKVT